MSIIEILFIPIFLGFVYEGILRKVAARMQNRVGPPIWQPLLDFIKLLSKESFEVIGSHHFLISFLSILAVASLLVIVFTFPFVSLLNFRWDFILVIYLLVFSTACFILAGFSFPSPYPLIGSTREITLLLAYELPLIIILLFFGMSYYSLLLLPENLIVSFPLFFTAFLLITQAKLGYQPFNIGEAEQEIVAGYLTECSGFELAMFNLAKSLRMFIMISLASILFFNFKNIVAFVLSSLIILFFVILLRVTLARFRIDQGFKFLWLVSIPLILIDLIRAML
ncbi:MAG: NADH-quinone oxidoreductase subunit H [Candidatus Aenigmarchaeota archaeon]|nr:NADH-quinone oxidoreductase subunit H [Candidatus Aenigmarchaeota archaeon]